MGMLRDLFLAAAEPTFPHCSYVFDIKGHTHRGAYGKWCHEEPTYDGRCRHHTPEALRASAVRRAQRAEPENPWVDK